MSGFDQDLIEARAALRAQVNYVLSSLGDKQLPPPAEREKVEFKEEPGRRGRNRVLLPPDKQNPAAVELLAREVPCLANTPGGGALLLGIEDSGQVLGTELDADWLRHRLFERVEIAPAIEERYLDGERVLVLYVAEAREPVEDPDRKIRWRVGAHCVPIDRSEWWLYRAERTGLDPMAAVSQKTLSDVAPAALLVARRYLANGGDAEVKDLSGAEVLRRLGALRPDDQLTQAGALVFCPAPSTLLSLTRLDVVGGDILTAPVDMAGLSLLEQLSRAEDRLDAWNATRAIRRGLVDAPVRELPPGAVREAVLNGLVHRDWMQPEPVAVTWVEQDSSVEVISPGGFVGGVNSSNVLTQRYARYPALSDLFRALRLVDKQGIGVDRMYREMIVLGHRPPRITQEPGPHVRTRLVGGDPVIPVVELVQAIRPVARQRDVRVAVIIYELLHRPFLTIAAAEHALQSNPDDAREALEITHRALIANEPLVVPYKDVWVFSSAAHAVAETSAENSRMLATHGLLTYRRPDSATSRSVVEAWLAVHDRITSGDYAVLTGLTTSGAKKVLERLVPEILVRGNAARGRNVHYRLA